MYHFTSFMLYIRNFGGKLGTQVQSELKINLAGEISGLSLEFLKEKFGEDAEWILNISKGSNTRIILLNTNLDLSI